MVIDMASPRWEPWAGEAKCTYSRSVCVIRCCFSAPCILVKGHSCCHLRETMRAGRLGEQNSSFKKEQSISHLWEMLHPKEQRQPHGCRKKSDAETIPSWACRPRGFAINTLVLKISVLSFHIQKLVKPAI